MGFGEAVKLGFSNYLNFSGRACRSEFWYWALFSVSVAFAAYVIDGVIMFERGEISRPIIYTIVSLATLLPDLSVTVRRLHDLDRSGWWIFLGLIPLVGQIIQLIWFCTKGTDGPNRFGADRLASLGLRPRPA